MLAQEQCAALIESMFGVTTSDDYRPVAWMGRYPVDVTTMLVVLILAAIYTLQLLAYHAWSDLMVVWTSIGAAFLFIEMHGAGPELPWWDALKTRFAPRPKFHVVPKMHSTRSADPDDVYTSIDPILDKISKFGIGSLTASERRQLDRERERLLKKSE